MSPSEYYGNDKSQPSDVRFAETESTPDLKVSGAESGDDSSDKQLLLIPAPVEASPQPGDEEGLENNENRPMPPSVTPVPITTTAPSKKQFIWAIAALGLCYICGVTPLVLIAINTRSETFTSVTLWPAAAVAAYLLNGVWLIKALKSFEARTANFSSISPRGKLNLALTALVPLAWYGFFCAYFKDELNATVSPALQWAPWLIFASFVWYNANLVREQYALLASSRPERLATIRNKGLSFDARGTAAAKEILGYVTPLIIALTTPFFGALFATLRTNSMLTSLEEAKSKKEAATKRNSNILEIRYRSFAALERWVQQRIRGNKDSRLKNGVIAVVSTAVMLLVSGCIVSIYSQPLYQWWLSLFHAGASGAGQSQELANIALLRSFGLLGFLGIFLAFIMARRQPTHYRFGADGFMALRRWSDSEQLLGRKIIWKDVQEVLLVRNKKKTQSDDSELVFKCKNGPDKRLKLGSIESVNDREAVLEAIEKWAPHVARDAELVQALQPPVDQSYTEMWLQALTAPPKRDRLKPLEENMVLGEGRYRVRRSLGVGGQGAAYEAYDTVADELVVLKEFLLPIYVDVSVRKEVLERFEGEARILKNLSHDQIVKLSDFFIEDHRAYLVIEHIDGVSLRQLVNKEGPLSEEQVKELSKQMCTMLTYLHQQNPPVVHRDFTPDNLILRNDGKLKLIDFNVARQVESTVTSSVVGKPSYLPPEQFRGAPVPQSDIYGMGATLYFLLTGKDPEPISVSHPRTSNSRVTKNIDDLVARATAMDVKNRFQDCEQILKALDYEITESLPDDSPALPTKQVSEESAKHPEHTEPKQEEETRSAGGPKLKENRNDESVELKEQSKEFAPARAATGEKNNNEALPVLATTDSAPVASRKGKPLLEIGAAIIALTTIATAALWNFVPTSVFWGDPKAELHVHERDGVIAWKHRNYASANTEFDRCIQIDPNDADAHCGKAMALAASLPHHDGLVADAVIAESAKAAQLEPDNKLYQYLLAYLLLRDRRYAQAKEAAMAAIKAENYSLPFERSGFSLRHLDFDERIRNEILAVCDLHLGDGEAAAQLLTPNSDDSYGWPYRGGQRILAEELSDKPEEALNLATAGRTKSVSGRSSFAAHYEALKQISSRLKLTPSKAEKQAYARCMEGMAYNALGQYKLSLEKLEEAAQLSPDFTSVYLFRADTLWHLGKNEAALQDVKTALKANPASLRAHYLQGRILMQLRQYAEAIKEFDIAGTDSEPDPYAKARCLAMLGQYDKAAALYNRAGNDDTSKLMRIDDLHRAGKNNEALKEVDTLISQSSTYQLGELDQYPYYLRARINESLGRAKEAAQDKAEYESMGYSFNQPIVPDFLTGAPTITVNQIEGNLFYE